VYFAQLRIYNKDKKTKKTKRPSLALLGTAAAAVAAAGAEIERYAMKINRRDAAN